MWFPRFLKDREETLVSPLDPHECEDRLKSLRYTLAPRGWIAEEDEEPAADEREFLARNLDLRERIYGSTHQGKIRLTIDGPKSFDRATELVGALEAHGAGTIIRFRSYAADEEYHPLLAALAACGVGVLVFAWRQATQPAYITYNDAGLVLLPFALVFWALFNLFDRNRFFPRHHRVLTRFIADLTDAKPAEAGLFAPPD